MIILTDDSACKTATDNSSDEETYEYLNGAFDATIMHLFNHGDDPSSSEEESDDENVYVVAMYVASNIMDP